VSAGIIDKRHAMPISIWSHVGASLLVILVAIDLRIGASYVVALAGFAIYFGFDRTDRVRHLVATFLGLGLLFLGIEMLKSGSEPIRDFIIREGILAQAAQSPVILLILGGILTVVSQSSTVTGAIAVTATNIGLLDFPGACLLVYGANLGSGINHVFLARGLKHEGRQIALMQAAQKLFGFTVLIAVIGMEYIVGRPLLAPMVAEMSASVAGQVAWV